MNAKSLTKALFKCVRICVLTILLTKITACEEEKEIDNVQSRACVDGLFEVFDPRRAVDLLTDCENQNNLDPNLKNSILSTRAYWRLHLGDDGGALNDFNAAIALDPQNPTNSIDYLLRGHILLKNGAYMSAISDFNNANEFFGKAMITEFDIGLAFFGHGDLETSLICFKKNQEKKQASPAHALWGYIAEARLGRQDLEDLEKVRQSISDLNALAVILDLFLGRADPDSIVHDAVDHKGSAIRLGKCNSLIYVAEYHILQGEKRKAANLLSKARLIGHDHCSLFPVIHGELARLREFQ